MNINQIVRRTLAGGASGERLAELALCMGELRDLWLPIAGNKDNTRRHWREIYSDDGVDVYAISWLPGRLSEMHDHGESSFGVACVQGNIREQRPGAYGDGGLDRILGPGEVLFGDVGVSHLISWSSGEPAVTIHCFGPRFLKRGGYYSSGGGILLQRRSAHGCMTDAAEIAS